MRADSSTASQTAAARSEQGRKDDTTSSTLSASLAGIDSCLRRWKASRHEGQTVVTELSNALLLRTYVDKGRDRSGGVFGGGGGRDIDGSSGAVWGALAHAGATVSRVSVTTEARVRRLHGDLSALQDVMVAAASQIRRHAQELRHRCCCRSSLVSAKQQEHHRHPVSTTARKVVDVKATGALREGITTALTKTEDDHEGGDDDSVIGGGYGLIDVADAASEVAEMLFKEALVTATVAQGVGEECDDGNHRETLTVYAAAWMMRPYVDARRMKELETMVGGRGRDRGRG
ncbi:unnamed protein product [Pylaiella littoralis]